MTEKRDLLIEIGTEELPPLALQLLSKAFEENILLGLNALGFSIKEAQRFATPRRLAVLIKNVPVQQAAQKIQKKGPALSAAFDKEGNPSKAAQGFAQSCGVTIESLQQIETDKGIFLNYEAEQDGVETVSQLGSIVERALAALPIPKRMRWGNHSAEFIRPIHWIIILFGGSALETNIMGIKSGRLSYGHRFYRRDPLTIGIPEDYESILQEQGKVVASFEQRQNSIREQIIKAAKKLKGEVDFVQDESLLSEVTALVEWPSAVTGSFEQEFLQIPQEVLITSMKTNQKYFPVFDSQKKLTQHFVTISNIESEDVTQVKAGNERVIRPRLADAKFFWNQDLKTPLMEFNEQLKSVVFQQKLGTVYDKVERVSALADKIALLLKADKESVGRAALLCKADLMSAIVGEFPKLQGIMGRYYAQHAGEPETVAKAIEEHYLPTYSGDRLPSNSISQSIAIADKIDTITGIFAIGQKPTGVKDPFALRRAAIGILKIMIDCKLDLDLYALIQFAAQQFDTKIKAETVIDEVFDYIYARLRGEYESAGYTPQQVEAVLVCKPLRPLDFDARIKAVKIFATLPEAESLAAANKRIRNILKKVDGLHGDLKVQPNLLKESAEQALHKAIEKLSSAAEKASRERNYTEALKLLSTLKPAVDTFFDNVMVMADDKVLQQNRLALLSSLQNLFLQIADISQLQV